MTKRRELLLALGAGAVAASFGSFAQQQGKVWRVGFLAGRRPASLATDAFGAFPRGMSELGYVEGKNLVIEWRFADGEDERLAAMAAELVQNKVDVIVANAGAATRAAQKASSTVPIVMGSVGDPVGSGLVKSLARPGGNITGLTNVNVELGPKHLEMLLSLVPKLSRVAVLADPSNASSRALILRNAQAAAQRASVEVLPVDARTVQDIESVFPMMTRQNIGAVYVPLNPFLFQHRRRIAELAVKYRLPSAFGREEYVAAGGLISYGPNIADLFRRAATYVDKIFKGAKPADLPVEQPTKFELIINHKTATALGLTIPQSLLISADKVIE